jgi:hypothetical protein
MNKNSFCIFGQSKLHSDSEPPPWRKNSAPKAVRPNPEFIGENGRNSVGVASQRPLLVFFKNHLVRLSVFIVPSQNLFSKQSIIAFPAR